MSPNLVMIRNGKKFMWDGQLYDKQEEVTRAARAYEDEDFQVQIVKDGGKFLVYTRRPAKEAAVTAQ